MDLSAIQRVATLVDDCRGDSILRSGPALTYGHTSWRATNCARPRLLTTFISAAAHDVLPATIALMSVPIIDDCRELSATTLYSTSTSANICTGSIANNFLTDGSRCEIAETSTSLLKS